jgi:predicted GNAT superfamily acetyltransferase
MEIHIREIHDPDALPGIIDLEAAIWGDPHDTIRPGTMMALVHEGGLLAGAYDGGKLVGFVFGFPTRHNQRHHSHMTGVLEAYRGTPAALLLKRFQRDWCLGNGYEQVVWTFDPMRGVNASFNFRKLGVRFARYIPNCYGRMKGINAGAPSDRAYVVWDLRSERVYRRIYAPEAEPELDGVPQANTVHGEEPVGLDWGLESDRILFQIPEDWGRILQADTGLANMWRVHSREFFGHYFAKGYVTVDFVRHPNRYVLERSI